MVKYIFILSFCTFCVSTSCAQDSKEPTQLAEQAKELSTKFLAKKEYGTAKILLINAFNHEPTNVSHLKALYDFHRQYENEDQKAKVELIKLVENALYVLKPNDVLIALDLLKQLVEQVHSPIERTQYNFGSSATLSERARSLLRFKVSTSDKVEQELVEHLNELERFLNLDLEGMLADDLLQRVNIYRELIHKQVRLLGLAKELKRYTRLLERTELTDLAKEQARAMMLSNAINMIYSEDLEAIPKEVRVVVTQAITQARTIEKKREEKKSRQEYEKVKKRYDLYLKKYQQTKSGYQKMIDEGYQFLDQLRPSLLKVKSEKYLNFTKDLLSYTQEIIQGTVKKQQKAYNSWAADICLYALKEMARRKSPIDPFTDDDAIYVFKKSKIASIDVRFISPEVSNIYHQILRKLIDDELPADKAIKLQKDLMKSTKKDLSAF